MSYLEEGGGKGIRSWIFSTDHKRIGILYLASMMFLFFIAVVFGVLMRIEQMTLDPPIFPAQMYNALFTLHGVIMIFMFVLPGLSAIFGNFFLPIMIGAKDVAFPRLNLMSWYFF
ncbi:MAG: cbb3-type cytochrome c oxidase subunit I, partial [Acidobacteria bacterium]|nr:cbb3-type cytochrome c oxidase subunit I [Acidobacteriota bacterium]